MSVGSIVWFAAESGEIQSGRVVYVGPVAPGQVVLAEVGSPGAAHYEYVAESAIQEVKAA